MKNPTDKHACMLRQPPCEKHSYAGGERSKRLRIYYIQMCDYVSIEANIEKGVKDNRQQIWDACGHKCTCSFLLVES